ncbi:hypothetical protein H671_20846 [Cricetulus griseus]|nr:hypothetical protein H671_20846 [Cricetulus griseus]
MILVYALFVSRLHEATIGESHQDMRMSVCPPESVRYFIHVLITHRELTVRMSLSLYDYHGSKQERESSVSSLDTHSS